MYNIKARKQKFETRARIQVERKGSRWREDGTGSLSVKEELSNKAAERKMKMRQSGKN